MPGDDGLLQNPVCDRRHEQHRAIQSRRQRRKVVFTHPPGHEGKQRQPKQQMQVGPQDSAAHVRRHVQHMVMVVPVNAEINEAQYISKENRQQRTQRLEIRPVRHFHFQHHYGDDDGEHPVAECFHAVGGHVFFLGFKSSLVPFNSDPKLFLKWDFIDNYI